LVPMMHRACSGNRGWHGDPRVIQPAPALGDRSPSSTG
jgi:hypothetical protein